MPRVRTVLLALIALVASLGAAPAVGTATSGPEPAWAPAGEADIYPGRQVVTQGSQCTSNFIFIEVGLEDDGTGTGTSVEVLEDVLIGMAAHCAGTGGNTETDGCEAGSRPLGTSVDIDGAVLPGTLAYSSWLAMQSGGPKPAGACAGNDFALVSVDEADWSRINPSLPFWGGPVGIGDATVRGESNYSFGNSGLRGGREELSPKQGVTATMANSDWTHVVYSVSPGIPGDSGSGTLDADGAAIGVTSVLYLFPNPAGNGLTDLGKALQYARDHTGRDYRLVNGTEAFDPSLLP